MMEISEPSSETKLACSRELHPVEPLWKRVPTRDEQGKSLSDFMMIVPKLGTRPPHYIQKTLNEIEQVLAAYRQVVIFADMNLKLNTLWITVKPVPGICLELAAAVKIRVPEALLVAHKQE